MAQYTCEEAYKECNTANVGNAKGQANCTTTIQDNCGSLDPASYSASGSATTSSASSASSGTASATSGSASATGASTSTSTAGAVPTHLQHIGTGAAAAALGLFAYML